VGRVTIFVLFAVMALSLVACGDDDDESTNGAATNGTAKAVAPPPERAFNDLATALESQGLVVTRLRGTSLDGAEAGVSISGDRSGSARSFAASGEAHDYADKVAMGGDKTTIVGTVVFQARTQDDADFFAAAYED
jgi:hypothetical protein